MQWKIIYLMNSPTEQPVMGGKVRVSEKGIGYACANGQEHDM